VTEATGIRVAHWRLVQEPNGRCLSRGRKRFSRSAKMPVKNNRTQGKAAN
jgi:hypothetical protein